MNLLCEGEKYAVPGFLYKKTYHTHSETHTTISIMNVKVQHLNSSLMMKWKDKDGKRFQCQTHDLKIVSDRTECNWFGGGI